MNLYYASSVFTMVKWQNQGDPGYATPSSSDDEQEEKEWTPTNVSKIISSPPKREYYNKEGDVCCHQSFPGWYYKKECDGNVCELKEDAWEQSKCVTVPPTPGGGVMDPRTKLKRFWGRNHFVTHKNIKKDAGDWSSSHTDYEFWSPKKYSSSISSGESLWDYLDSVCGEEGPNVISSPAPSHKLQSFLSKLQWGKCLLTPEKPKNQPLESVTGPFLEDPKLTPDGKSGFPFSWSQVDDDYLPELLNEPKGSISPISILHEDFSFKEQHSMASLNNGRISEFKNDPWSQPEFAGKDVNQWNHRVLFPSNLIRQDNSSDDDRRGYPQITQRKPKIQLNNTLQRRIKSPLYYRVKKETHQF